MDKQKNRKYVSPAREKQATDTRNRVIDAAEALLLEKGFAGTTVAEVARRAGVSPQTVYAIFSSKAGIIMAAIEDRVLHDERNVDAIERMRNTTDPVLILRNAAAIIRNIYEGNAPTFTAVYGARMVSPQLAELETELNDLRREKQAEMVDKLVASGKLLPHLDKEAVRDLLWMLSGREIYYLLVIRRGWSPDRYEAQLASLLITSLVHPDAIKPHLAGDILTLPDVPR
ncbi:putative Transcriptional regulator, TetR family [uncultured delta proteobacterium]|uniref:Putative Transcriptional regulator, TetR family n=1 Tax=uncultured delta proteobacterium TaxID=34034 RepID=A0A212IVL9_9DELT|nr:putative Transcriptional regulator, TetR family [uncultured delta proteobacterium]